MRRTLPTETPVTNTMEILAEAAATVPTDLPALFRAPEPHSGLRVHMRATRTRIILYCMLRRLVLNTVWRPYGEGSKKVYPFGAKQAESDYGATYDWNPYGYERYPKKQGEKLETKAGDMFVYFIFTTDKDGSGWKAGWNYLVATRKGDKKFYRLPLNNIFEDARICMGDTYALQGATLLERFENALKFFEAAPWNTHIGTIHEHMQALFSFNLKGEQIPIPEDWHTRCQAVSNSIYSDLPKLIIT